MKVSVENTQTIEGDYMKIVIVANCLLNSWNALYPIKNI